jgi:2-C-methyl-D-erythritol 4-phosphate cytidylyltransferase
MFSLYGSSSKKVHLKVSNGETNYKWILNSTNSIKNIKHNLYLNVNKNYTHLILSKNSKHFYFIDNYLYTISNDNIKYYLRIITNNKTLIINLTKNKKYASFLYYENNEFIYKKSKLLLAFENNNSVLNLKPNIFLKNVNFDIKLTSGILLSAGFSNRFKSNQLFNPICKQLFEINNKPIIQYSIETMLNNVDLLLIVTNSTCYQTIKNIVNNKFKNNNIIILQNDINCRLKSIETGLNFLNKKCKRFISHVIIHDSARPYINSTVFKNIKNYNYLYSQYYLKLTNGLATIDGEFVDRNNYIEMVSPIFINLKIAYYIFKNYMSEFNRISYEWIPILHLFNFHNKIKLIEGKPSELRKITYFEDI